MNHTYPPQQPPLPPQNPGRPAYGAPPAGYYNRMPQPQPKPPFNWLGFLGLVAALLSLALLVIEPGWVLWACGVAFVLSVAGLFFKRRACAVAGLVIVLLEVLCVVLLGAFLALTFMNGTSKVVEPDVVDTLVVDEPVDSLEVADEADEAVVGFPGGDDDSGNSVIK